MSSALPAGFSPHVIASAARPPLACRLLKHADFQVAELPEEQPDFDAPRTFLPLTVLMAPYGPLVLSVGARPAYGDGAVSQWLAYLCREEGYEPGPIERLTLGSLQGVVCDARQQGDGIVMHMRLVLLEDGGRLYQLSAMAPAELWSAVETRLQQMLVSFEIADPRGQQAALFPGEAAPASAAPETPAATADETTHTSAPTTLAQLPAAPADATAKVETARLTAAEFSQLVLAADPATLDPEHPINANLRNRGIGFVPRVMSVDAELKAARLAAGAVEGFFRVPFGWHVIDDGRRVLVLDDQNRIQVNLNLRAHEGRSPATAAREFVEAYRAEQPDLEIIEHTLDGIAFAGVRGLRIDGEVLTQFFLVKDIGCDGTYLVGRATAGNDHDAVRALNLAGDIVAGFEPAAQSAAVASSR